jgi:hypothetical protein
MSSKKQSLLKVNIYVQVEKNLALKFKMTLRVNNRALNINTVLSILLITLIKQIRLETVLITNKLLTFN